VEIERKARTGARAEQAFPVDIALNKFKKYFCFLFDDKTQNDVLS